MCENILFVKMCFSSQNVFCYFITIFVSMAKVKRNIKMVFYKFFVGN